MVHMTSTWKALYVNELYSTGQQQQLGRRVLSLRFYPLWRWIHSGKGLLTKRVKLSTVGHIIKSLIERNVWSNMSTTVCTAY